MKRVAIYARVSTDRNQTTENQTRQLTEVAERLGWNVVAVHLDQGISGARGRDRRPGFDALLRGVARGEYDLVAAWSVCRLGRSLPDLVGLLADMQARGIDLYLHQQGVDTSTPSGRMMFQMLGIFAEFERAMLRERIIAGQQRARAAGVRFGRPPVLPSKIKKVEEALAAGTGIRETARQTGVSPAKVSRLKRSMQARSNGELETAQEPVVIGG